MGFRLKGVFHQVAIWLTLLCGREARLVVIFPLTCIFWVFGGFSCCEFFRLLVIFFVSLPQEGYQNPCLPIIFLGLKRQMPQNTVFAVLYILRVFCSKKREAHQRPISLCQASCNPTLFLGLYGFATQHSF